MQITITNGNLISVSQTLASPTSSYNLPESVNITGANSSYDSTTGILTLSNLTENIDIIAQAILPERSISLENLNTFKEEFNKQIPMLVEVTYIELKKLRDNEQLLAGTWYRMTDYICTTTETISKSANHQFDIIIQALDKNILSEHAKAIIHKGDTYFSSNQLNKWRIWYCLDNDTSRFEWADTENGKGVIYRMIDEFDNDCPYDFKNILLGEYNDTLSKYIYFFTFDDNYKDASLKKACHNNIIKAYVPNGIQNLNFNIFKGSKFYNNVLKEDCYRISFLNNCNNNTLNNTCRYIYLENYCEFNTFDSACSYINFGSLTPGSSSNFLRYVHVHSNIDGTSQEYKEILIDRNLLYTTDVYPIGSTEIFI